MFHNSRGIQDTNGFELRGGIMENVLLVGLCDTLIHKHDEAWKSYIRSLGCGVRFIMWVCRKLDGG